MTPRASLFYGTDGCIISLTKFQQLKYVFTTEFFPLIFLQDLEDWELNQMILKNKVKKLEEEDNKIREQQIKSGEIKGYSFLFFLISHKLSFWW